MAQNAPLPQADTSLQDRFSEYAGQAHPEIFADLPPEEQPKPVENAEVPRETQKPAEVEQEAPPETPEEVRFQFESIEELAKQLEVPVDAILALKHKTKVDDQEGEYSLSEIVKGYQLDKHNQNKSKELSAAQQKAQEALTAYEAQQAAAKQTLTQLDALGRYAQEMLNIDIDNFNKNPEIQQLRYTDPSRYMIAKDDLQMRQNQISAFIGQVNQQATQQQAQAQTRQQAQIEETLKNRASIKPEWADEGVFIKDTQAIREACLANGLKAEELPLLLTNPAYLKMADMATRWMNLQKQKPEVTNRVKTAPKLVAATSRTTQMDKSKLSSLKAQLKTDPKNTDLQEAAFAQWATDASQRGAI